MLPPKVTVCALSYNTGEYTELAIRSALASNYPNLEIICIDDGSTDSSPELLDDLARELGFKFYRNKKNTGIPESCNLGLDLAEGKYFILIGDDIMLPNRIDGDVEILEANPSIGFVCGRARLIGHDGQALKGYEEWSSRGPEGLFQENPEGVWSRGSKIFTPTASYRTATLRSLGGWDTQFDTEDKPMFIKFASERISGWGRNEITTLYRKHEKNYSKRFRPGALRDEVELLERFGIKVPRWAVILRLLSRAHFWMLFLNFSGQEARLALEIAGKGKLAWTTSSKGFKAIYLASTCLFRPNRAVTRHTARYFRGR